MVDPNEMEKTTTTMMEHLCDHLCRFPWGTGRKEDLEDICADCKMGQYVCDILNTYNSACKLQAAADAAIKAPPVKTFSAQMPPYTYTSLCPDPKRRKPPERKKVEHET